MKSDATTALGQFARMLGLALLMVALILGVLLGGCLATDAIVSRHSLSTKDAPGFSEEKFSSISTGMTPAQVRSILGEPLSTSRVKENGQEWWYTAPKEPIEGWGTWDGRYLIVSNGMVAEIYRHTIENH
jgi:outer membrane protein assembly factor BamE (lipoprotein component of BamABCDE complex)